MIRKAFHKVRRNRNVGTGAVASLAALGRRLRLLRLSADGAQQAVAQLTP